MRFQDRIAASKAFVFGQRDVECTGDRDLSTAEEQGLSSFVQVPAICIA